MDGLEIIPFAPVRNQIPWQIGAYYDNVANGGSYTTSNAVADRMYGIPILPVADSRGGTITVGAMDLRITTASAAGKKGKLAIAKMNLANGKPGLLVAQTAEFALDPGAVPFNVNIAISAVLNDLERLILLFWGDGTPGMAVQSNSSGGSPFGIPSAAGINAVNYGAWIATIAYVAGTSVFAADVGPMATFAQSSVTPAIGLKRTA